MSYVVKHRAAGGPILADYTCPLHGVFELVVDRDANGEAPDSIACPISWEMHASECDTASEEACSDEPDCGTFVCGRRSTWTPSVIDSRVRKVEVVRGKWEKPERPTYYDTRDLGEGQDLDEWRENRRKIRDEERKRHVMEMVKDA